MSEDQGENHIETATVTVWLSVESESLSRDALSQEIGMPCDRGWSRGDRNIRSGIVYKVSNWKLELAEECPDDVDSLAEATSRLLFAMIERIRPVRGRFRSVVAANWGSLLLGFRSATIPAIVFNNQLLRDFADLGVEVQIDLILSALI